MTKTRGNPDSLDPCERLRSLESIYLPDARNGFFVGFDARTGLHEPVLLAEHLADVAGFSLDPRVPISIRTHFETAKNLYAYAWFVYRFYAVSEQHALTSLEFALRERFSGGSARGELLRQRLREGSASCEALPSSKD